MKFTSAESIEDVIWTMKLADLPRSQNRRLINDLFNGLPPYSDQEVLENSIDTNVNFLEATKLASDARRSFSNAFQKPTDHFKVTCDYGPAHKRGEWGRTITRRLNKIMKDKLAYVELLRSTFASLVLHGIGPVNWANRQSWCPEAVGIEDVLIPGKTLVSMENLEFFAIFRQYTPAQLFQMTHGPVVDPGWQMPVVNEVTQIAQQETIKNMGYAESWFPEKLSESIKSDLGFWAGDAVSTIDCWDFYFLDDDGKGRRWQRRIVLDFPVAQGSRTRPGTKGQFLYNPGNRAYAEDLSQIMHWQFADGSAVAPFRYHSVRSIGFLLYSICHLQNRLRCKFNDAVFESLLWYFRVANPEDAERLKKIDLHHLGIIPDGLDFIKAQDRYQVNQQLVESALQHNRQTMADNSSAYTQSYDFGQRTGSETATEVMAKVNESSAMVGSMLNQAYIYQKFQYMEIARRFTARNSSDPDVRKFRIGCMRDGIPEQLLDSERWEVQPERVLGAGNKTLEIAQADKLMAARNLYDPESQREILHLYTEVNTDDPGLAQRLVPLEQPRISDSVHDAELALGTLMQGFQVSMKRGMNHIEYVDTMLANMARIVQQIEASGGMASEQQVNGLANVGAHIEQHIQLIAQDPNEKQRVKQYGDDLGKLMNMVRAYGQRLQQQRQQQAMEQQRQAEMQSGMETNAKLAASLAQAQQKMDLAAQSHQTRTAMKQQGFQIAEQRKQEQHEAELARQQQTAAQDMALADAKAAAQMRREAMQAQFRENIGPEGE